MQVPNVVVLKIAVSEAMFGDLSGLDGVEADGVADSVGVAGDTSQRSLGIALGVVIAAKVVVVGALAWDMQGRRQDGVLDGD